MGEVCGGWLETEEETKLKNHLKWARIKVRGDGSSTPKTVKIESEGNVFEIPVWCEAPVRSTEGEKEEDEWCDQRVKGKGSNPWVKEFDLISGGGARGFKLQKGHVGSSKVCDFKRSCDQSREGHTTNKEAVLKKSLGPDSLAQVISEEKYYYKPSPNYRPDPFNEELKALQFSPVNEKQNSALTENTKGSAHCYEQNSE